MSHVAAVTVDLADLQPLIIGIAAFLLAWGTVWRGFVKPAWKRLRAIHDLIEHELRPNGGSSMKDAATASAVAASDAKAATEAIADQIREIRSAQETTFTVFDVWIEKNQREHDEIWAAMAHLGYDRRRPPIDPGNGAT